MIGCIVAMCVCTQFVTYFGGNYVFIGASHLEMYIYTGGNYVFIGASHLEMYIIHCIVHCLL